MIALLASSAFADPVGAEASVICAERTHVVVLETSLAEAEMAIQSLDGAALDASLARIEGLVPCLEEPLFPDQVARWFRTTGIQLAVNGDTAGAVQRFRAARGVLPAYRIDESMGAPILEAWAQAVPGPDRQPLPAVAEGSWTVDGTAKREVPVDRPFVLQWLGADGAVRGTSWLPLGTSTPPFGVGTAVVAVAPLPVAAPATEVLGGPVPVPVVTEHHHPSRGLALAGIGAGLLAGAGIATAATFQEQILTSEERYEPTAGLVTANRVIGYGAGGLGVAAVGLGASAILRRPVVRAHQGTMVH